MRDLFYPASLVVVGVSPVERNLGRIIAENLERCGFRGEVYLVGKDGGSVTGRPIYPSVRDIPAAHIDLATVIVPARAIPEVLEDCGQKGVKWAVTLSSGFTEYAEDRRELEQTVSDILRRYGMRMVGPNCQAIANTANGLVLPFAAWQLADLKPGPVAVLAQSGTVALVAVYGLCEEGIGFSKYVSMGNKLSQDEVDYLSYFLHEDEETRVICLHLEGVSRGRALVQIASTARKPIVLFKSNTSPASRQIARSHTGALAGDDSVAEAAFRQAGIIQVRSTAELVSVARALTLPPLRGDRIAVVSSSGGSSVIAADLCAQHGFELPAFPDELIARMTQSARAGVVKLGNPMDLGDVFDPEARLYAFEQALALPGIDGLVASLHYSPEQSAARGMSEETMIRRLADLMEKYQKPVAMSYACQRRFVIEFQQAGTLPIFNSVEDSVHALGAARQWTRHLERLDALV